MRILFFILILLVAVFVLFVGFVRLAPVQGDRWSKPDVPLRAVGDYRGEKTFEAVRRVADASVLAQLQGVALATPRTKMLRSNSDTDWLTFVTRSRMMGYPDYTSARVVETDDGLALQVYGRARFGKLDLGVNKARVQSWLDQLGLLTPEG